MSAGTASCSKNAGTVRLRSTMTAAARVSGPTT
jgi:hypothetical protein